MTQERATSVRRCARLVCAALALVTPGLRFSRADAQVPVKVSGTASAKEEVSLYPQVRGKAATAELTANDLTIVDAGESVDTREIRLSRPDPEDPRPVAFVFDRLEPASAKNAARIAHQILADIKKQTGPCGVWTIDSELRLRQRYTADHALVETAIADTAPKKRDPKAGAPAPASEPAPADAKQEALNKVSDEVPALARRIVMERHELWGPATLLAFAEAERALGGRKVIVFFTQKAPTDVNAADDLRSIAQSLNDASTSVFVVDANPLDGAAGTQQLAAIAMGGQAASNHAAQMAALHSTVPLASTLGLSATDFRAMTDTIANLEFDAPEGNRDLLTRLADATGGQSMSGGEGTRKLSRDLLASLNDYYKVNYPLSAGQMDGKYHPVLVKVKGHGATTASRLGYFVPFPKDANAPLLLSRRYGHSISDLDRLASGASASDLTLHAAVLRFGVNPTGVHNVIALEIPNGQLEAKQDGTTGLFSVHASVAAEVRDGAGAPVARFAEEFRPHGALSSEDTFRSQALSLIRSLDLPAGEYSLLATVRDWNTGRIGTIKQSFQTRPEAKDAALSDVVLVRSTEPNEATDKAAPLQYGHLRVLPNISGEMGTQAGSASLFFELYPEEKDEGDRSLYLNVSYAGRPPVKLPLRLKAAAARKGSAQVATVNLGTTRGPVHVTLCLEQGKQTIERDVSFVSPGAAEAVAKTDGAASGEADASADQPRAELFDLGPDSKAGSPLSASESEALIASARESALSYTTALPNFLCVEAIDRSEDPRGNGSWKHMDSMIELLRYQNRSEHRTVVERNGEKSNVSADKIEGARSNGEFGGLLQSIFDPAAEAVFAWQQTQQIDGQLLQVFAYKIDLKHSNFYVSDHSGDEMRSAFHGLIFVDSNTRAVRRLVAQTEGLPPKFGVRSSWMAMNYDYVAINRHDYLLPTKGEVGIIQGKKQVVRNELRFSDYRRFGSRSKIMYAGAPLEEAH